MNNCFVLDLKFDNTLIIKHQTVFSGDHFGLDASIKSFYLVAEEG